MLDKIQLALKEGIEAQNSVGDKMSVQMSVQNLGGLTRTAQQLMTLLTEKPTSNSAELAAELNLSVRTIERNLKVLQDKQKIKRIGATKNGHWILV